MIDFSACSIDPFRMYGGGNGNKIGIIYEGATYMLKFPPKEKRRVHYTNACLSEYLGCHIYELLGIEAQETLYGVYRIQGKDKKVVACMDFTGDGFLLMEFAKVKNACIGGSSESSSGYATELNAVLEAIDRQSLIDPIALKQHFWDMFIVDAYLGNFDRHNGNWGMLVNEDRRTAKIAPIYDCGSCLYPQMPEEKMMDILRDLREVENRVYVFPTSALKHDGQKINYFDFISSHINRDCTEALRRIHARIHQEEIDEFISSREFLSDVQKKFYCTMLRARKEKILDVALERIEHGSTD
jgi:hypothetical protein